MPNKFHRLLILVAAILIILPIHSEAVKIATWNIKQFPGTTGPEREDDFRKVIEQLDLDILVVQEMYSQDGVDRFLNNIMNYSSPGTYQAAEFEDGNDTNNALFYKNSTITCLSHEEIIVPPYNSDQLREISECVLEIKEGPGKGTRFRIYSVHLKSGTGPEHSAKREHETQILRDYLNTLPSNSLFLVCGDFNMQSSEERAFEILTEDQADNDGRVKDPINKPGNWYDNEEFADIHTQSTCKEGFGCGGLDDRFDMFLSSYGFDTSDELKYKEGSYIVYGNDGKHFDKAVNDPPDNEFGTDIADALFEASYHLPVVIELDPCEGTLAEATYESILAMVEPSTGLPHDRFDASLFDIMPQFAVIRTMPYTNKASGASLESWRCTTADCRHTGVYGLKIEYEMPSGTWGSYNVDSYGFDVSEAVYLEAWVKGAQGGERFEFVLWSDCEGGFPGRPDSGLISASQSWELKRIPLEDFQPFVDLSSLCRLSIGFNDAIHPGGTIYLDEISFVDTEGTRIHVPLDEETNVTNIGLYIASVLAALDQDLEDYNNVVDKLSTTLTSIEALQKWYGFPQTHNHVVSLSPSEGETCISTVDLGNFAAGLIILRQRVPELSSRANALLEAMEWDWLYDDIVGLPYGCRYPDGSASEDWHYDWLCADSRLAHFIGIGTEKIPPDSWNNLNRQQEPSRCINLWHFEPGWDGGGLFMAFLPGIFLDEAENEIGTSADNFVRDQICYYQQIGAPAWGWSATALPPYGEEYCGYGCVRDDVLVPHASILAADYVSPAELTQNLLALEALGARDNVTDGHEELDFGFRASVNWQMGEVASVYLVLDQSMSFLSLANHITNGCIRKLFCQDDITVRAVSLIPDYCDSCAVEISGSVKTSGDAGIEGVTITFSNDAGSTTTDSSGNYTHIINYGWSGTVTPSKTGYAFSPSSRTYSNITSNQTEQDYTGASMTYTISGNVSTGEATGESKAQAVIGGIVMSGLPGDPITDSDGNYSATVDYGWSGIVTPIKAGYTFSPASRTYSDITSDQLNQDYTATAITPTISGTVKTSGGDGIDGVTITFSNGAGSATTDSSGNYTHIINYGWSGTVTPSKEDYSFTPSSRDYANVTTDQTTQNYTTNPYSSSVSITNPQNGATVWGTLTIQAEASSIAPGVSIQAIIGVEFYIDGTKVGEDAISPYEHTWDTTGVSNSNHTIKAKAINAAGQIAEDEITVTVSNNPPQISLNRTRLNFGSTAGTTTCSQTVLVSNSGGRSLNWSTSDDQGWFSCSPTSGTGNTVITFSVDPTGLSAGTYTDTITITDPNAPNSPQTIYVTLNVMEPFLSSAPFGSFDTPEDGTTGITGAIPIAGWVLDDIEVDRVEICRAPVGEEPTAANGLVYIGDAILIDGARPDAEQMYPGYPLCYQAGWGYMMLTYGLPDQGNGTYTIYAIAYDKEGNIADLGFKTITCDNSNATKPFGTIDTPIQGGEASGDSFVNFGWALTPLPNYIPEDGSTITVWIDGEEAGNPVYDQYRSDVAELFPGYVNSDGAVGYYFIDTTQNENGVHTIAWSVEDIAGNTDDIGTRYFKVINTETTGAFKSEVTGRRVNLDIPLSTESVLDLAPSFKPIYLKMGYKRERDPEIVAPDSYGVIKMEIREVERIEIEIGEGADYIGYLLVGDKIRALPIGSTLDVRTGIFSWQPGPGFIGDYDLVFIIKLGRGELQKVYIRIRIVPKFCTGEFMPRNN